VCTDVGVSVTSESGWYYGGIGAVVPKLCRDEDTIGLGVVKEIRRIDFTARKAVV
jgi:hypothetical protein